MRLIDADALLADVGEEPFNWTDTPEEIREVSDYKYYVELIKNAPTIDAVPVVRCEECQYWQPPTYQEQEDGSTVGNCTAACKGQTDMNWFCADGTR